MASMQRDQAQKNSQETIRRVDEVNAKLDQRSTNFIAEMQGVIKDAKNMRGYSENRELQDTVKKLEGFLDSINDNEQLRQTVVDQRHALKVRGPNTTLDQSFSQYAAEVSSGLRQKDGLSSTIRELNMEISDAESFADNINPEGKNVNTILQFPKITKTEAKMDKLEESYDALSIPAEQRNYARGILDALNRAYQTKAMAGREAAAQKVLASLASPQRLQEMRTWIATVQLHKAGLQLVKDVNEELAKDAEGNRIERAAEVAGNASRNLNYLSNVLVPILQTASTTMASDTTMQHASGAQDTAVGKLYSMQAREQIRQWREEVQRLNERLIEKKKSGADISEELNEVNKTTMTMFILAKGFRPQLQLQDRLEVTKILDQINADVAATAQAVGVEVVKAQLNPAIDAIHINAILGTPLESLRPITQRMYSEISQAVSAAGADPNLFWEEFEKVHERTESLARSLREVAPTTPTAETQAEEEIEVNQFVASKPSTTQEQPSPGPEQPPTA